MPTIGDFTTASSMSTSAAPAATAIGEADAGTTDTAGAARATGGAPDGDQRTGAVLADLEAKTVLFHFELGQLVLAHEFENLLQLVEIHQGRG